MEKLGSVIARPSAYRASSDEGMDNQLGVESRDERGHALNDALLAVGNHIHDRTLCGFDERAVRKELFKPSLPERPEIFVAGQMRGIGIEKRGRKIRGLDARVVNRVQ